MTGWYRRTRLAFLALWLAIGTWALKHWSRPDLTRSSVSSVSPNLTNRQVVPLDSSIERLDEFLQRMPFDDARSFELTEGVSSEATDSPQLPRNTLQLMLSGVVEGAVPQAIIVGLPGAEAGHTMRLGDQYGMVRLVEVHRERVVLDINGTRAALLIARPAVVSP